MLQRCNNPRHTSYDNYGGRGIQVCERWAGSFEAFYYDMGARPSPGHTIERRDVNGNYEPSNCLWATLAEQANNKRNNRFYEVKGERLTEAQLVKKHGLGVDTFRQRLARGIAVEDALKPPKEHKQYEFNGRSLTLGQWAVERGINYHTLYRKVVMKGISLAEVFEKQEKP